MNEVLKYLINSYEPLVRKEDLKDIIAMSPSEWQAKTEKVKGKYIVEIINSVSLFI